MPQSWDHSFVIPAYGEPPWIERCIESVRSQSIGSELLITTSTPNAYLDRVTARYRVPLIVNPVHAGISSDWNFALASGGRRWVTLAHQDDWYDPSYSAKCRQLIERVDDLSMVFTAADERDADDARRRGNTVAKRLLCALSFRGGQVIRGRRRKRRLLALGNPVPCPSVMLNRVVLSDFSFPTGWRSNLDWKAWLDLAEREGAFGYVAEPLVHRTLHAGAATSVWLAERAAEDSRILHQLWPWPIGSVLSLFYSASRWPYRRGAQ